MPHRAANVGLLCFVAVMLVPTYVSSAGGERPVTLAIYPQHVHFMKNIVESKTITCKASQPVSRCEFRLFDLTYSHVTPTQVLEGKTEIKGLKGDECATTLAPNNITLDHSYTFTCRVRTENTDWVYASMSVFKSTKRDIQLERTGYNLVVLPGRKQDVAVRGWTWLSACRSATLRSIAWQYQFSTSYRICYAGTTFYGGDQGKCEQTCGLTIIDVTEADNGIVLFDAESSYDKDITFIILTVAKLPNLLALTHELVENDNGSVTLEATCKVSGGRSPLFLTWYVGGEVVPDEAVRSVTSEGWVWPFEEQTLIQVLTMDLNASHAGKEVVCAATHLAYNVTIYNTFTLRNDSTVANGNPARSLPTSSSSEMSVHDATVTTWTTVVPTTASQGTTGVATSGTVGFSEKLNHDLKCERAGRQVTWLYVVIGVLTSLLVLTIIVGVVYARRKAHCCFSSSKDSEQASVTYRRSLDATLRYEEMRSPTVSSVDRSSAVTGLEYAEIRVSMVQRCVDKMEANKDTQSAITGGIYEEASRPNSLYLSYDEQV